MPYLQDAERASERLGSISDHGQLGLLHSKHHLAIGDFTSALAAVRKVLASPNSLAGYDLRQLRWVAAEASHQLGDTNTAVDQLRLIASEAEDRGAYRASNTALKRLDEVRSVADQPAERRRTND